MIKLIAAVLITTCFVLTAYGQNGGRAVVDGTVADANGSKVAGATVKLISENKSTSQTVATDKSGYFRLLAVPGKYELSAFYIKFGKSSLSVPLTFSLAMNTTVTFELQLVEQPTISERVDVSISTGTSQPFSEVSKSTSVVDMQQIEDRNEIALTDTLRTLPGFRIQQLGGLGRTASIKTRGLRNQDTAILLDGQRLRDPSSITGDASAFLSDVSLVNVERIEVLRGSGSSVYGTNAIGGVVDVQTRRAGRGFSGRLLSEYGGLGYSRFSGKTSYGTNNGKYGFTAGLSRFGVTRGIDLEDDANNTSIQGRFDAVPTSRFSFSGRAFLSDSFARLNTNPDTFGTLPASGIILARNGVNFTSDANDPDNFQRSDFFAGQFQASFILNTKTVVTANYQGLRTNRENENGVQGPGFQPFGGTQFSVFDGQVHSFGAKLDWSPVRDGRLITGYENELEKYGNTGLGPTAQDGFTTNVDQSSNVFFAQYIQGFLQNRLQLAGGFRAQAFNLTAPVFSINNAPYTGLNLSSPPLAHTFDGAVSYYFPVSGTKIRAHVGNGYRVPSLYERFGSFYSSFSQSFTAIGDPNLEPERSVSFDAGIDQTALDDRLTLTATYFYTRLTDTIGYGNVVPDIGSTPRPFGGYENTGGGIARGAEFSGSFRPAGPTGLNVSYTFTNSDQRAPQVSGTGIIRTLGIPDHQFSFNATQNFGKRLTVNFDFEASSGYLVPIFSTSSFSTRIYRFDGNRRGDFTGRYALPLFGEKSRASFFVTVENVFGYTYFENGFATAGRTVRAGISFDF